jgi:hypothetical protein
VNQPKRGEKEREMEIYAISDVYDVMAGIFDNRVEPKKKKKIFFTSPFVVNGIVGMQRARGNEVEYFHVSLERAERESLSL